MARRPRPTDEIEELIAWRTEVSLRLDAIEKFQKTQARIWWGIAGAIGLMVLPRFFNFLLESGALAAGFD